MPKLISIVVCYTFLIVPILLAREKGMAGELPQLSIHINRIFDMTAMEEGGPSLNTGRITGAAYTGKICDNLYNSAFTCDDGSFSGVITATHELGHLLGLIHDKKKSNGCDSKLDGDRMTMMEDADRNVNEFVWSECSKTEIKKLSWSKNVACLEDRHRDRHFQQN